MKKCSTCKKIRPLNEYYSRGNDKPQSNCKECHNRYCIDRWIERKKQAIAYKGGKCSACGYNKYYGALDFHHSNPHDKDMDWGELRKYSDNRIKEELDKCILLCSNCHREAHERKRKKHVDNR